ncbi:probable calcium-binding protein CML45 [Rutidosis leptorrhynchoides]|uniref:probable calcium-binding protein CML45 n=1 Tax=Rutidosis leptorrhynchoides TaxID=125765 RepID=UPI003A9A2834
MWRFIFATQATTACGPTPTVDDQHNDAIKVRHVKNDDKKLLGVELKIIMERFGMLWDHDDTRQVIGSEEMLGLFDEDEPSLDEVKEAFSVFDKNNDGYIDEKELQIAFSKMGYLQISESDCRRMIDKYDNDKDAKISFTEFLKLTEDALL